MFWPVFVSSDTEADCSPEMNEAVQEILRKQVAMRFSIKPDEGVLGAVPLHELSTDLVNRALDNFFSEKHQYFPIDLLFRTRSG